MSGNRRHGDEIARLADRLARLREGAADAAAQAAAETAGEIAEHAGAALARAPGGLPRLARRVETEGEGARHDVVVRHPAAPHVEFGTRHMPPRPFLQPAADAAQGSFRRRMKRMIGRLVRSGK